MTTKDYVTPDELDYRNSERVTLLDNGRFIVHTGDGEVPADLSFNPEPTPVRTVIDELADDVAPYAIDITAKTDYGVDRHRVADVDLQRVFVDMLRWYATRVEPTMDPAEVIDVLLRGTEFGR
ncbi:hypothetical protein SAMN04487950_2518 [Halogranum rubrum]|uniref:Uncharacterized protein n=1 Tax=Halogranum rubrum TaxID=553466 RepID=A0A1I4EZP2_9EURY|nr:hypothetical protein [Halogranum rubrum]SFL11124.1 hypothetical protein SAMN04487950_2518 [Halogranum rubrum]